MRISFLVVSLFISFIMSHQVLSKEEMKVVTLGVTAPILESTQGQFSKRLLEEVLNRLNFKLIIKTFPPIRLAERTMSGKIDGELIRMSSYGDKRPYLTKVKENNFKFNLAAYSNKTNLTINNWDSFKGLHIAYRRGMKIIENELIDRYENKYLHPFPDPSVSIKQLMAKRVDVLIGVEYFVNEMLKRQSKADKGKIKKVKRLKSDSAHVFFGEKFSHLAHLVSNELLNMKRNGEYKKIMMNK